MKNHRFTVEMYDKDSENAVFQEAIDRAGNNKVAKNMKRMLVCISAKESLYREQIQS
ncbi:hypothetical protein AAAC51_00050 [Priestia megaterium]